MVRLQSLQFMSQGKSSTKGSQAVLVGCIVSKDEGCFRHLLWGLITIAPFCACHCCCSSGTISAATLPGIERLTALEDLSLAFGPAQCCS
jgi:hypothetical protein